MTSELQICRVSLAQNSKSFHLASRLLASKQRDHVAAVYAWCRRADDAIDLETKAKQPAALAALRAELDALERGDVPSDVILSAFRTASSEANIPLRYAHELLDGMEMDALGCRYTRWDDLLHYCYCVASTVGLMMCHVMGVSSERAYVHAVHLGIAMQLTNIARDVREDWERGRCYLPDSLLIQHRASTWLEQAGGQLNEQHRQQCRPVLESLLATAERYYESADQGLRYLSSRNAFSVAAARWIYSGIGRRIAASGYDIMAPRAVVPLPHKVWLTIKSAYLVAQSRWSSERSDIPVNALMEPESQMLWPSRLDGPQRRPQTLRTDALDRSRA